MQVIIASLLVLAVLSHSASFVEAQIVNDSLTVIVSPDCSLDEPCLDLDRALDNLTSDMTLQLLPGVHLVTRPHTQDTRGISNVHMVGSGPGLTTLHCNGQNGLAFVGMTNMTLSNFTVSQCGLSSESLNFYVSLLKETIDLFFLVPDSAKIAVLIGDCRNVALQDVAISDTSGLGLLGINILGSSKLSRVKFTRNRFPDCLEMKPMLNIFNQLGGGAYVLFSDYHDSSESVSVNNADLTLENCRFVRNRDCTYSAFTNLNFPYTSGGQGLYEYSIGGGGGLSVVLANSFFGVNVSVIDTDFHRNDARYGAGAYVATFAGFQERSRVTFLECRFDENGIVDSGYRSYCYGGGGMAVFTDLLKPKHLSSPVSPSGSDLVVSLVDTTFERNWAEVQGGGIMAYSLYNTPHSTRENPYFIFWNLHGVNFFSNSAKYGSAGYFHQKAIFGQDGTAVIHFRDMIASFNYEPFVGIFHNEEASAIELEDITSEFYGTNTLSNNMGSALRVQSSIVSLLPFARLVLSKNTAHHGAGVNFQGVSSGFLLSSSSRLEFSNNTALISGGAVFFDNSFIPSDILMPLNMSDCFIATTPSFVNTSSSDGNFNLLDKDIMVSFTNNYAPLGGMIFGSSLEACPWAVNVPYEGSFSLYQALHRDYNSTFLFDTEPDGKYHVSTSPKRLHVNILPDKVNISFPIQVFPGQSIDIEIFVMDFYDNVIPAVVTSAVNDSNFATSTLGSSNFWHTSVNRTTLSIAGNQPGVIEVLILSTMNSLDYTFLVELLDCPVGFSNDLMTNTCKCAEELRIFGEDLSCFSGSGSFRPLQYVWIGVDAGLEDPTTADLIVYPCILNYCSRVRTGVNRTNVLPSIFDIQCAENRIGILCGECAEGFSSTFGFTECAKCSHYNLWLIPVFAIAGAVLFAAVALLEITVDKGLTNALILFMSLLAVHNDLGYYNTEVFDYAFLPVHLLSLQIGVTTCFYDGMTTLHRSFWYFVFPLYLFLLMGIFTCLTRRSSWLSVHFSPTKTLATLLSMCYFYTLTICLQILLPVNLLRADMHIKTRWLQDPSQPYFQDLHAVLGAIAIFFILIYLIPFPLMLLFPSLSYKYLHKVSIFLDVFLASFKPKFRFWLGIRFLLVTVIFLSARAPGPFNFYLTNILLLLFTLVQTTLQPFKDKWANYADVAFLGVIFCDFWLIQVGQLIEATALVRIIAVVFASVMLLFIYCLIIAAFILLIHRQFPMLGPKIQAKLKGVSSKGKQQTSKNVSHTVVEMDTLNPVVSPEISQEIVLSGSAEHASSPTKEKATNSTPSLSMLPKMAPVPRYRESLLETIPP